MFIIPQLWGGFGETCSAKQMLNKTAHCIAVCVRIHPCPLHDHFRWYIEPVVYFETNFPSTTVQYGVSERSELIMSHGSPEAHLHRGWLPYKILLLLVVTTNVADLLLMLHLLLAIPESVASLWNYVCFTHMPAMCLHYLS